MKPRAGVCRVVTTSMSARLLLGGQMQSMSEVPWAVVSGDDWPDAPPEVEVHKVPMRREPAPSDVIALVRLIRLFAVRRFRVVQTHTPKASMLGLPAARLTRTPTVYTIHGALYFRGNGRLRNTAGWVFERWCCAWADLVLLQSEEDFVVLPSVRIVRASKLRHLGNGIDMRRFYEVPPVPGPRRPVVLMVSRLVREKGCNDFIELASRLGHLADFRLVGPAEPDQSDALTKAEIDRARAVGVLLVGPVEDVRPELIAADVVVLPSFREGIPRAVMEAAATSRPVAAYDIRGVREVVPHAAALLAPVGDVDALEDIVRTLILDEPLRRAAGRACAEHVRATFAETSVVSRLRDVYRELGVLR